MLLIIIIPRVFVYLLHYTITYIISYLSHNSLIQAAARGTAQRFFFCSRLHLNNIIHQCDRKFGFENGKLSLIKDVSLPNIGPLPALVFVTNSHSWRYIFSTIIGADQKPVGML